MIQIAVLGFGTIGSGLYDAVEKGYNLICKELQDCINIKYILDLRDFPDHPLSDRVVHDFNVILSDPDGVKMSKSRGNVIDPNEVVETYGADTLRTYVLFMGDYTSAAPWSEASVRGCKRFLERVADLPDIVSGSGHTPELESAFHKTIRKVSSDIEDMKFNTAIASLMSLINSINECGKLTTDELKIFIKLLCPFAPHLCEEIWSGLGENTLLSLSGWPEYDESKTVDSTVEIAIQICGKFKGTVVLPASANKDEVIAAVKSNARVSELIEGKTIIKEIYVPGKLVNIVVK